MGLVKTSITIPDEIFRQVKEMSENFSQTVAEALKEYLQKKKSRKRKEASAVGARVIRTALI